MVRDPFLTKRTPHPDDVIKSVPVEKVWSDEAREAAAAARKAGYDSGRRQVGGSHQYFNHPDGHMVSIDSAGNWEHDSGGKNTGSGRGADSLKAHLNTMHPQLHLPLKTAKAVPDVARPPMPKTIEVDGDQDSLARTSQSTDPTDSFRVGYVTDAAEEGDDLMSPAPNPRDYGAFPLGKSVKDDMQDTLTCATKKGWGANSPQVAGGGAVLSHPDLPGHHLHVAADGKWSHMGPHTPDGHPKMHGTGAGAEELKSHLRGLHQGLAKRGPRIV